MVSVSLWAAPQGEVTSTKVTGDFWMPRGWATGQSAFHIWQSDVHARILSDVRYSSEHRKMMEAEWEILLALVKVTVGERPQICFLYEH